MDYSDYKLLTPERERRIIEQLQRRSVLSVAELAALLAVSPATVRRDLQSMDERRLLQRIRGGATLRLSQRTEPLFQNKQSQNTDAKERIARSALDLIEDHDRIYLDGGSTVLMLARLLDQREDLTVVTNSLMAASELMTSPHRLILVGGEFRRLSRTLVGPLTASVIDSIHVNKAFMGTIGFTSGEGMTTTDPNEAFTKECVMRAADQVILLADSTKLGVPSFARSGNAECVDVLITEAVDRELRREVESMGIKVIVCES